MGKPIPYEKCVDGQSRPPLRNMEFVGRDDPARRFAGRCGHRPYAISYR